MGFLTEFNWMLVIKKTRWNSLQQLIAQCGEDPKQKYSLTKDGFRIYPTEQPIFMCVNSATFPVAIVKIVTFQHIRAVEKDKDGKKVDKPKTYIEIRIKRLLKASQKANLAEVFRHLDETP